jgi:hypothetical protein
LLTLGLLGLTLVEIRPDPRILLFTLPAVFVAALWVLGRMVYWGCLSHAILHVPDGLGKELATDALRTKWYEPTLESVRLHLAASAAVDHYHKRWSWFSSLGTSKIWTMFVVYIVSVSGLFVWYNFFYSV